MLDRIDDPVFIVGSVRSGTRYLTNLLNLHPNLILGCEDRLPLLFREFFALIDVPPGSVKVRKVATDPEGRRELGYEGILGFFYEEELLGAFREICERNFRRILLEFYDGPAREQVAQRLGVDKSAARRWGDKMGTFWPHEFMMKRFPNCRLIHAIRDGRDVVVSMRRFAEKDPRCPWKHFTFEQCSDAWIEITTKMRETGRFLPPDRTLEVRYEDLAVAPVQALERITRFLGESARGIEEIYRRFADSEANQGTFRSHGTAATVRDTLGRWQRELTEEEQETATERMGPLLRELGYIR